MTALRSITTLLLLPFLGAQAATLDKFEPSFEWIDSDDISLTQSSLQTSIAANSWDNSISLAIGTFDIDYKPVDFDFLGSEVNITEDSFSIQANTQNEISDTFWIQGGIGLYDGFTNYRSAWLAEYYRQQFSDLTGIPGAELYINAHPKGMNASIGARWEYRKNSGFAQVSISRLQDDISPGYEIDFDGIARGELTLATSSISLSTENILHRRVRSLFEVSATKTSARSTRYSTTLSLNTALGDNWIWRNKIGYTTENPDFAAKFITSTLEYQANDRWAFYLDGSHYEDNGEIENSFLFTTAAPEISSRRVGIGARWTNENWSGRLYFAPMSTYNENTDTIIDFFEHLYADRDWTVAQVALSRTF